MSPLFADLVLFAQRPPPPAPPAAQAGALSASLFGLCCFLVVPLLLVVPMMVGMWKVFEKAGQPGWAAIIPYYNTYVLTVEVARKEILWFVLFLVPFANVVAAVMVSLEVARKFGRSEGFGVGLALLPMVFYPILGFGDARYRPGSRRADDDDDRPRRRRDYDEDDDDDRPRRGR